MRPDNSARVRAIVVIAIVAAVVLAIAGGVAWFVFKTQVNGKMHFDEPELTTVLSQSQSGEDLAASGDAEPSNATYVLVEGSFHDPMREDDGPHMLCLVRVDPDNRSVAFFFLPHNIEMVMSDDNYHVLSYAKLLGGDAELVTQVENLTKLEVSHLVRLDADGLVTLVDAIGGIEVDLEQEADDPDTGSIYIPAGKRVLDGQQTLALVRCDNYHTPLETRAAVQSQVMKAILAKFTDGSFFSRASSVDAAAGCVQTTLSFDEAWGMVGALRPIDEAQMYTAIVPGATTIDPDGIHYSISRSSFDSMLQAMDEGRNPDEAATVSGLTPSLVKINVKNGAGLAGGAASLAQLLESYGYQVPETGNADNYVYDETLVVYKDELMRPTADDILSIVGNGRVIEAGAYYDFETDIMVIIGKDWTPKE